jgi:DNA-directed RNA polymerase specialized sigma24 family protein
LHRIAYTKFIDGQRTERRDATIRDRHSSSSVAANDPFETAMVVDEARRLHQAIDQLDSGEKAVLVLHYLQGLRARAEIRSSAFRAAGRDGVVPFAMEPGWPQI